MESLESSRNISNLCLLHANEDGDEDEDEDEDEE